MVQIDSRVQVSSASERPDPGAADCPAVALTSLRRGQCGVILATQLEAGEAAMLRAMGLRPKIRVKLCRVGEPFIVELCCGPGVGARVALHRVLAERIMIGSVTA